MVDEKQIKSVALKFIDTAREGIFRVDHTVVGAVSMLGEGLALALEALNEAEKQVKDNLDSDGLGEGLDLDDEAMLEALRLKFSQLLPGHFNPWNAVSVNADSVGIIREQYADMVANKGIWENPYGKHD